jgi:hypothetical protein
MPPARARCADAPRARRAQFALTLGAAPGRDALPHGRRAAVFGRLVRGYGLLRHLEALPTRACGAPLQPVRARTRAVPLRAP